VPPSSSRTAGFPRSGFALPLAVLSALAVFALLWWQPGRPTVGDAPPDGGFVASVPAWTAAVLAACALVSAWLAFVAGRAWVRSQRQMGRLAADAARIALGEYGWRAGKAGTPALEPVTEALNRLASLVAAAESVVGDRDRQLATMRGLGGLSYWETDGEGRFTRVEYEASWPRYRRVQHAGRLQFDGARALEPAPWQAVQEAIAQRRAFRDLPLERIDAEGRKVCVLESGSPWFDRDGRFLGYSGVTRLMTPETSTRGEAGARVAMQTSSEAMLLIALEGDGAGIHGSNAAAHRLFERDAPALEAEPVGALLADDEASVRAELEQALAAHRPLRRTLVVRNRFDERIEALARLEPVPGHPRLAVLALDPREPRLAALRERANAEESLRARLADQTRRLERAMREAESFASSLTHDLRAPLRAVDGFAKLLLENHSAQLDTAGQECLARILTGCERMDDMIHAVLALSRIDHRPLAAIPVDLGRIAAEVLETLTRQDPARRVEVRMGKALHAHGDPALLRIVLENLLGNAWKYSAPTEHAVIRFEATTDAQGRRTFCIADNGVGFDMRHVDRLFGLFQRLHAPERFPGSGVGLATVKRIVERHGGSVWAESAPGDGSRFFFRLGSAADDQRPSMASETGEAADAASGPPPVIA